MAFRMRGDVEDWFRHIQNQEPIQTKFDLYYLCLMMGLATGRADRPANASEFVNDFVKEYKPMQRLVIGLMLVAELHRLGIDLTEREEIQRQVAYYLNPNNPANLTEEGFNRLNAYANGGYTYLVEHLGDKPQHIEEFLQMYIDLLNRAVEENKMWKLSKSAVLFSRAAVEQR